MASPRTRRALSDLKPHDENNVRNFRVLLYSFQTFIVVILIIFYRNALNVELIIHSGYLSPTQFLYVSVKTTLYCTGLSNY